MIVIGKNSVCCNAQLRYYDQTWDDGVCTKCDHHSPAIKEELEEV